MRDGGMFCALGPDMPVELTICHRRYQQLKRLSKLGILQAPTPQACPSTPGLVESHEARNRDTARISILRAITMVILWMMERIGGSVRNGVVWWMWRGV